MNKAIIFSVLAMVSNFAHAVGVPNAVPAPGVLALVGIGALAVIAVKFFKK